MQVNYVISVVWAAVFAVTAIVGYIGDGPLHQPDNIWTNWLIQIALVILAIKFTEWYPEYTKARQEAHANTPHSRDLCELLRPLAAYLMPAGIVALIFGGNAWWIGAGLIVSASSSQGSCVTPASSPRANAWPARRRARRPPGCLPRCANQPAPRGARAAPPPRIRAPARSRIRSAAPRRREARWGA